MFRIDLHTHSIGSPDGGVTPEEYAHLLESGTLDCIAITDHNTVEVAQAVFHKYPEKIIVGEEIDTSEGEIIGLYLTQRVVPHQSPQATITAIRSQGGLVYIPHPFETVRSGLTAGALETIQNHVDIVEVHNGRAVFQNRGPQAATWARLHGKPAVASSDAHGKKGLATTYTIVNELPSKENLLELLVHARCIINRPPLYSLLYPKYNRFRKRLRQAK